MSKASSSPGLTLYNSLTKKEETFTTIEKGKVKMYTCGPTVYGRPHIGNYSSFLMADLLRRWLEISGYEVTHVKNITDVGHLVADRDMGEDKIEKQAREEKAKTAEKIKRADALTREDVMAIVEKYTNQYLEDEKALNMLEPFARPKATETIPEMIAIIETLVERGHAYETDDGVYFSVVTFPNYGKLSGNTLDNLNAGSRVAVDDMKKHPADFALWKKVVGENSDHILRWQSPWGEGFPGWHIECSAMSQKFLGEQLDIHTGGEDNIFPHHECEIAQSECAASTPNPSSGGGGGHQFSRFWLHKRRIDMGGEKMSKSLGNILTVPDIIKEGYDPLDLRYYFLAVHYRTQLKFTWKGMDDARKARRKILEWMTEIQVSNESDAPKTSVSEVQEWTQKFSAAMNDDLNTSAALAVVFDSMTWSRKVSFDTASHGALLLYSDRIGRTFGCFSAGTMEGKSDIPSDVSELLTARDTARAHKDFEKSDQLRNAIEAKGYEVLDTSAGSKVRKK